MPGAPWVGALVQVAGLVLVPLAYLGVAAQVEAGLTGRHGVRLLQPARDLRRALRKGAARRAWPQTRGLVAVVAALAAGALAPIVGSASPFGFHGDLAVFVGLLALYDHSVRGPGSAPRSSALRVATLAIAAIAGAWVGLADLAASPRWSVALVAAAAALLALRAALPDRRDLALALDRGLVRHLDGVVAVALSGVLIAGVQPIVVRLLALLAIAAAVGAITARAARPRPAALALSLGGAALCEGLAVALHVGGAE